jgi:hypothetical protein
VNPLWHPRLLQQERLVAFWHQGPGKEELIPIWMIERRKRAHIMIITMWTVLIALIVLRHILPKSFLAFLASKRHLRGLRQLMILGFGVALGAVVPLLAAWSANRHLRVQNVFAGGNRTGKRSFVTCSATVERCRTRRVRWNWCQTCSVENTFGRYTGR